MLLQRASPARHWSSVAAVMWSIDVPQRPFAFAVMERSLLGYSGTPSNETQVRLVREPPNAAPDDLSGMKDATLDFVELGAERCGRFGLGLAGRLANRRKVEPAAGIRSFGHQLRLR
jgi:hypothetical protein